MLRVVPLVCCGLLVSTLAVQAKDDGDLAQLRAKVDAADATLHEMYLAQRDEGASLRNERNELARKVRDEQNRRDVLTQTLAQQAASQHAQQDQLTRFRAPLLAALEQARAHIDMGLPFAVRAR